MHAIVPEPWVPFDPAFLSQDVIILTLQEGADLAEAGLVVDAIAEAGCVDDGQADARALLVQLELDGDGLDAHALLLVRRRRVIGVAMLDDRPAAQRVDEGGAARTRSAANHQAELDPFLHILLAPKLDGARHGGHNVDLWVVGYLGFGGEGSGRGAVKESGAAEAGRLLHYLCQSSASKQSWPTNAIYRGASWHLQCDFASNLPDRGKEIRGQLT